MIPVSGYRLQPDGIQSCCRRPCLPVDSDSAWMARQWPVGEQRHIRARIRGMTAPKTVAASLDMTEGSLATDIAVRHHRFAADEAPPVYNSTDAHPDPYDYILAGVAACTLISIRLSAEAKGYPLERAAIEVTFERRPTVVEGGQADQITRMITLEGDLTGQQRMNLFRAANCAAYRSIIGGIPIDTHMAS